MVSCYVRLQMSSNTDKHIPMHLRRKMKPEKPKPKTFELMPSTGVLMPGQRVNIQVKFMPTEEVGVNYGRMFSLSRYMLQQCNAPIQCNVMQLSSLSMIKYKYIYIHIYIIQYWYNRNMFNMSRKIIIKW